LNKIFIPLALCNYDFCDLLGIVHHRNSIGDYRYGWLGLVWIFYHLILLDILHQRKIVLEISIVGSSVI
jgi:hypothetical protein